MDEQNRDQLADLEADFTATNPYKVLGLSRTATQIEIKRTYFGLIRKYPPETAGEQFKIIRAAYEKIKDVGRRKETDIFLPYAPPEWTPEANTLPNFETTLYPQDIQLILGAWGELGRTDFAEDFQEINL